MARPNKKQLAKLIAEREGGKKRLSIADITEVQRLIFEELASWDPVDVLLFVRSYPPAKPAREDMGTLVETVSEPPALAE